MLLLETPGGGPVTGFSPEFNIANAQVVQELALPDLYIPKAAIHDLFRVPRHRTAPFADTLV